MKKYILLLMPIFLFFVLCQNGNKKAETAQVFPSDTIPMQFSHQFPTYCLPILDGIVNDSLHFKVFFDTGSWGSSFSISDSFKNLFNSDSAFVQIGRFKKQMDIFYYRSNERIFDIVGKNTILVGWHFFENKIIGFDFKNQHIFLYEGLPDVTAYSKTKIILSRDSVYNSALLIPTQVVIQGKALQDTFNIDTGCNSYMVLSAKHIKELGIDKTNAYYGKSTVSGGLRPGFSLPADTIKIGDLYVANQNMPISFSNYNGKGLLGTRTMENFIVVLDLINYNLYLKKIDK